MHTHARTHAHTHTHTRTHTRTCSSAPQNAGRLSRLGEEMRQAKTPMTLNAAVNVACTPLGCMELIHRTGLDISGKHVVVLGRSNIVGLPASMLALHMNATGECE